MHQNQKIENSFQVDVKCNQLITVYSEQDIYQFLAEKKDDVPYLIIGGASNVLFTQDYNGIILKNEIKGIEIIDENSNMTLVKVGAGESWHQFVQWAVSHRLGGIENLALIPGTVGAAPIQNIGAYGTEQNATFHSLSYIDLEEGVSKTIFNSECHFGYRNSIFKQELKGKIFITRVNYLLSKNQAINAHYADVANYLEEHQINKPSITDINEAIISIRTAKLPDPKQIGNAGSFFKNPLVDKDTFKNLLTNYPTIPNYPAAEEVKLAAAWLIDQCGLKGYRKGDAGTHIKQALVLVNYGEANGKQLYELALKIQTKVKEKFGITLEMEVNII